MKIIDGASIIVDNWINIKKEEKLLIITDDAGIDEAMAIKKCAEGKEAFVVLIIVPKNSPQMGKVFDDMIDIFLSNDVIIGATSHSIITTNAVKQAVANGIRYLSLPLSTNTGKSLLTEDFIKMDVKEVEDMASRIMPYLDKAETVTVKNDNGTSIEVKKCGRRVGCFNGDAQKPGDFASSSFEVYFAMEEEKTNGNIVLDGSFGYIGAVENDTELIFKDGRLVSVEETDCGKKLMEYMEKFNDKNIYVAGEFGIGLNKKSRCIGNSYIEDESTYGTFHIGMGRNLALGGVHDAKGHFDLVFKNPDIYADDTLIIENGEIIV